MNITLLHKFYKHPFSPNLLSLTKSLLDRVKSTQVNPITDTKIPNKKFTILNVSTAITNIVIAVNVKNNIIIFRYFIYI